MADGNHAGKIIVGVDGSEASIEALRQAGRLAGPLQAGIEATACWEYPQMYDGFVYTDLEGFEESAQQTLDESLTKAFGPRRPANVTARVVRGSPRAMLIEASKDAAMLIVGRRSHAGIGALLVGHVSSACIAHADCPVLVVHAAEDAGEG